MKKIFILITFILMAANAFAQDGRSIYNKYSDEKGVSAVFISPAMFKMMGKIPELDMGYGSRDVTSVVSSLKGFYLINSENGAINGDLNSEVKRFINNGKFELMMEVKEDGEATRIFTVGDKKTVNSLVLHSYDGNECTFICIDGVIDRDRLEQIIADSY